LLNLQSTVDLTTVGGDTPSGEEQVTHTPPVPGPQVERLLLLLGYFITSLAKPPHLFFARL
jgi:hypothetical protein